MAGRMISLILPYWDRQEAADKALTVIWTQYADMVKAEELEVIVVDDGNKIPFVCPISAGFLNLRVVRLPSKDPPKSCVTPWNAGVAAATGDIIAISCIEVLHDKPVLAQLADSVEDGKCVLAAAYCPEESKWHCHSSVTVPDCPPGTGLPFLAVMRREDFVPFDEDFRDGAGYEDRDWIRSMVKANRRFLIRDDLAVTHPKSGAHIKWPAGYFERNLDIYQRKWSESITFVCLKAGKEFGPEYVNILHDMVRRNLPDGFRGRFVCLTDDPEGLNAGIEVMTLPDDLEKWWGKLYLFKRGLFPDGARMVFMDLDTLITGPLEGIFAYRGKFATLNDFYYPERVGPAVMLWEAGNYAATIWDEWVSKGKPRHPMGDLWWIGQLDHGRFANRADKLQKLFPGAFASFKANCNPYPPKGSKVVCFHGRPRPHEAEEPWVQMVWRIGGGGLSELTAIANTDSAAVAWNVRYACSKGLPELSYGPKNDAIAVLVGGGPSLAKTLPEVRRLVQEGAQVYAVNGAANYLAEHGIEVDYQVVIDARPKNSAFVKGNAKTVYVASQCAPETLDAAGKSAVLCHMNTAGITDWLPEGERLLLSSGTTVGLAAMAIAHVKGHSVIHLHGYDSSYEENHHAYPQSMNDDDQVIDAVCEGQHFKCAPWMLMQVNQFQELTEKLADDGVTIVVSGDGLLPFVSRQMMLQNLKLEEV